MQHINHNNSLRINLHEEAEQLGRFCRSREKQRRSKPRQLGSVVRLQGKVTLRRQPPAPLLICCSCASLDRAASETNLLQAKTCYDKTLAHKYLTNLTSGVFLQKTCCIHGCCDDIGSAMFGGCDACALVHELEDDSAYSNNIFVHFRDILAGTFHVIA